MRFALAFVCSVACAQAFAMACTASSPGGTTALVELYTSEGCDSCPPADRWLGSLAGRGYTPQQVVPIALHVDYWDYIGWKDPYARQAFTARQRKMAALARAAIVYTPQVLLQGRDFRRWGTQEFDRAVAKINSSPARARISLALEAGQNGAFSVYARAELLDPGARREDMGLYLAAYENKLVSQVRAGENRGKTLTHDYVVLEWAGPVEFKGYSVQERRALPLLPKAVRENSGVAAFVQDRKSGEVLQALMLAACPS